MKLLPKKNEWSRVLQLLDDLQYEDSPRGDELVARDATKALWDELAKRDSFLVHLQLKPGDQGVVYGPLFYEDEAKRFAESLPGYKKIIKIHSAATQMDRQAALLAAEKERVA